MMKTGPVRDAQQIKQCVYSILYDCGRCYIGETGIPVEVRIKEHKYIQTQDLLEKSELGHTHMRKAIKYVGMERRSCRSNPTPHTGTTRNQPTCLCWTIRSVNLVWTSLPSGPPLLQQKSRDYSTAKCSEKGKNLFFLCWYRKKYFFSPAMTSIEMLLWCKALYARSFNNLIFS
jgi:hypothetical protein